MPPFKLQRTATPTVKPFLRDFKSPVLGGLLEGEIQSLGAVCAKTADECKKMYRLAFLMKIIVHKKEKVSPLRQRKSCSVLMGVIKKKPSRRMAGKKTYEADISIMIQIRCQILWRNTKKTPNGSEEQLGIRKGTNQ